MCDGMACDGREGAFKKEHEKACKALTSDKAQPTLEAFYRSVSDPNPNPNLNPK